MKACRNILVGVEFDTDGEIAAGCRHAVAQGLWLAEKNGAALTFVHVIELPEDVRAVLEFSPQDPGVRWHRQIEARLAAMAEEVTTVQVKSRLLFGNHWRTLIQEVQQAGHDLVIVGTRGRTLAGRMLLGSTGNRLLRYCPCPVWAVKPGLRDDWQNILVAHDLTPAGDRALQSGADLARMRHAPLQVLHVLEHLEEQRLLGTIRRAEAIRRQAGAHEMLDESCSRLGPGVSVDITIHKTGSTHAAILDHVNSGGIDLLCMGSVARTGLPGLLTGNTAESVLPWVNCSLLVVKPEGFVSPLKVCAEA